MLELGGKSPVIMFDDADLKWPFRGRDRHVHQFGPELRVHVARSTSSAASTNRLWRARQDRQNFRWAADEERPDLGPLISAKQLTRVLGFIDQGRSDGDEVVTGGHRLDRKGYFVHPTVVTNVNPATSRLFHEEIFGPVVTILPFDDEDEAIALANDTAYGLAATAWTNNLGRAHRLAKRLKAGTVGLNCQLQSTTPCRSAATSSPAGATSPARRASKRTCRRKSSGRRCEDQSAPSVRSRTWA